MFCTTILRAQVTARNTEFSEKVASGNWKGIGEIYAPNGTLIIPSGLLRGRAEIQAHWQKNPLKSLEITSIDVNNVDPKTATETGKYAMVCIDGSRNEGHYLVVWKQIDDSWYILYDAVVGGDILSLQEGTTLKEAPSLQEEAPLQEATYLREASP